MENKHYEKVQIADIDTQVEHATDNPEHWTEHEMKWILDNVVLHVRTSDPRYFWIYIETDLPHMFDFNHHSLGGAAGSLMLTAEEWYMLLRASTGHHNDRERSTHPIYRGTQFPKKAYNLLCYDVKFFDDVTRAKQKEGLYPGLTRSNFMSGQYRPTSAVNSSGHIYLDIYKAHDDWFYIKSDYGNMKLDHNYKCDGFRGLKQALTDMGVVKQVVPKKGLISKFKDFLTK